MNKQPEALRLAECLDDLTFTTRVQATDAAAELRRLHAENEQLRAGLWHPPAVDRPQCGQEQDPVAWLHQCNKRPDLVKLSFSKREPVLTAKGYKARPLIFGDISRQLPKREPLTDEQEEVAFEEFWYEHTMETFPKDYDMSRFSIWGEKYKPYARKAWFARAAIERAHGIK